MGKVRFSSHLVRRSSSCPHPGPLFPPHCQHATRRNASFATTGPSSNTGVVANHSLPTDFPSSLLCFNPDVTRQNLSSHSKEREELTAALAALRLSSTLSPYIHGAHILHNDSRPFESTSPPQSQSEHEPEPEPEDPESEISDQEWEIRTGRAIYILQETLPTFFSTGLISSLELSGPSRKREPTTSNGKGGHFSSLTESLLSSFKEKRKAQAKVREEPQKQQSDSIYSPRVRLEYRPPVELPPPLPRTLRVEGLHLYIGSSVFVRHTLNALYTDLRVDIRRARVHGPPSPKSLSAGSPAPTGKSKYRCIREKSFSMGLGVTGAGRVSGAPAEWDVNCTYTFSPITGLIHLHTVDSIEPAPHAALFEALGRLGLVGGGGDERSAGSRGVSGMTPTGCGTGRECP